MTRAISLNGRVQLLTDAMKWHGNSATRSPQLFSEFTKGISTMTRLKLLSIAALLSAAITSPVLAQQASQEPGAAAFYQSLGVGTHNYSAPDAFAAARNSDLSVVAPPVRHHVRRWSRH
jgi:hypothetical protein